MSCDRNRDILLLAEWIGDLESETGGRIGLWKVCERNEMSDNCIGRLEDVMDIPSMSFQVNLFEILSHQVLKLVVDQSGGDNLRWHRSSDFTSHHHMPDVHDFPEVDDSVSHLRLDADSLR